MRQRFLV